MVNNNLLNMEHGTWNLKRETCLVSGRVIYAISFLYRMRFGSTSPIRIFLFSSYSE